MTNTAKPPTVLYFRENISTVYMDGSHMDNRFGHAFANRKRKSDVGPYVHLGQFKEEVAELLRLVGGLRSCVNTGSPEWYAAYATLMTYADKLREEWNI